MERTPVLRSSLMIGLAIFTGSCLLGGCDDDAEPPGTTDGGTDATGTPSIDTDGDTISDRDESFDFAVDTDGDGTPDFQDLDSDNDGFEDAIEAGDADTATPPRDTDSDGLPDFLDDDSDGNGIRDLAEGIEDVDGDGLLDAFDLDDDADRIPDADEIGPDPAFPRDSDMDGIPDFRDIDSDNDTIGDIHEATRDSDGDGTPDRLDNDSDDDGFEDAIEAGDADVATPPIDTDGDGIPDFRDADSDNDGLSDLDEGLNNTDRLSEDSDGDDVSDLIEVVAETDPLDATDNPRARGDFFFLVPFNDNPEPRRDTLAFKTSISFADISFLFDTTGSMTEIPDVVRPAFVNIINNLTCERFTTACTTDGECEFGQICEPETPTTGGTPRTCIADPERTGCIANLWTGIGTYDGNNQSYRNLVSVQPDPTVSLASVPTSANGGGADETLFESVACVAEPALCPMAGCAATGIGCPGFRADAIRILVTITDEMDECGSSCAVTTAAGAGSRLRTEGITFVGVDTDGVNFEPRTDLQAIAVAADSYDGSGQPLYYVGDGPAVTPAVVGAINEIISGVPLFVTAEAVDLPGDAGNALQFIDRLQVNLSGGVCTAIESRADLNGDGFDDAFPFLLPGTPVCWDVLAARNTRVRPTSEPQVFRARVTVTGDNSPLDSRQVFFLVPPEIEVGMID
ncbi:MAG: hypothetical protein AAGF12_26560 [Myxococcota bacterium]